MKNIGRFLSGFEVAVEAAFDAGAKMMYGYPITPTTEIFSEWIRRGNKHLQTEDEIAAGFAVCGGVMAGEKTFTATAGPGHILMQDALSMAEGMRLPFVAIIGQRGGPSSGTVIYSQQEVTLACFGGNGEGLRLVFSPSNLAELYNLTRKAFNAAWQYRFPAIVLTDGYLLKSRGVFVKSEESIENVAAEPLIGAGEIKHWRNIYTMEEELCEEVLKMKNAYDVLSPKVAAAEVYKTEDAEILLAGHGIVGATAKEAVDKLRDAGVKAGMFRPVTLRPLAVDLLNKAAGKAKKIIVVESSLGQLARILRAEIAEDIIAKFEYLQKPAMGIETEEIAEYVISRI